MLGAAGVMDGAEGRRTAEVVPLASDPPPVTMRSDTYDVAACSVSAAVVARHGPPLSAAAKRGRAAGRREEDGAGARRRRHALVQRHEGALREGAARGGTLPTQSNGGRANGHRARWRAWLGAYKRLMLVYSSCRGCALVPGGGSNRTAALRGEARAAWRRGAATC